MRISTLIFAAVALLLVGCVATDLRVTNRTGTVIHVYSGQTKKIATIVSGATVTVPHTTGKVIVVTGRNQVWVYDAVRSVVNEATRSYKRVRLHVSIGSDGSITLPSDKTLTPTQRLNGK